MPKLNIKPKDINKLNNINAYKNCCNVRVIGDTGVGKSCLIRRAAEGTYSDVPLLSTIGINIHSFTHQVKAEYCRLITKEYIGRDWFTEISISKTMDTIIICFDLTDQKSFNNVRTHFEECHKDASPDLIIILAGTKSDCINTRKVSEQDAKQLANQLGIDYIETSALTDENVESLFDRVAQKYLDQKVKKQLSESELKSTERTNLRITSDTALCFLYEKSLPYENNNSGNTNTFIRARTSSQLQPKRNNNNDNPTIGSNYRTPSAKTNSN